MYKGKIILASMAYRKFSLTEAMKHAKTLGIDEMEVTIAGSFTPHFLNLEWMTEREMDEKAQEAKELGVHVHALNVGMGFDPANEEFSRRRHINAFRLAKSYGAEVVTVGCGGAAPGVDSIDALKRIAAYYETMSLMAWNEYGIVLSVEAPHRCTLSERYEQILTYWAYMPERLRCTMDVAHITFTGAEIAKVMECVGPRLAHVHLRDADKGNSMIPYGEGKVDFAQVFSLLGKYGYKGKCSLEFPVDGTLDDVAARVKKGVALLTAKQKESWK